MTDYIINPEVRYSNRSLRYKRQRVSALLASEYTGHSVQDCMSATTGHFVEVHKDPSSGHASYSGLVTCGSVWDCPVCAAKIASRRKDELSGAIEKWESEGHSVILVTYTVRHNYSDRLQDLSKVVTDAIRFVKSGAPYQRIKNKYGIVGTVSSTEIVFNPSQGWHYHKHQAVFVKENFDNLKADELEKWLYERYNRYLVGHGYDSLPGIGVDVSINKKTKSKDNTVGIYLTKWGLESELTSDQKYSNGGINTWQLLDDEKYYEKFVEYSVAMKGKRRLTWSNGLRDLLCLGEEISDEELAGEEYDPAGYELVMIITKEDWRYICKNELRAELLNISEVSSDKARDWFDQKVRFRSGKFNHHGPGNIPPG